jgi:hypothetical protein
MTCSKFHGWQKLNFRNQCKILSTQDLVPELRCTRNLDQGIPRGDGCFCQSRSGCERGKIWNTNDASSTADGRRMEVRRRRECRLTSGPAVQKSSERTWTMVQFEVYSRGDAHVCWDEKRGRHPRVPPFGPQMRAGRRPPVELPDLYPSPVVCAAALVDIRICSR